MEQTAERLDAVLNECVRTVYPPETRPDDRLFTQPAYQLKLKDMWGVYANYKRARVATMGNILHKWRLLTTFHKASEDLRERFFLLRNSYRPFLIIARASFAMETRFSRSTE